MVLARRYRQGKLSGFIGMLTLMFKVMEFQNWWKGWSGGDRVDRSSLDVGGHRAIKLTR